MPPMSPHRILWLAISSIWLAGVGSLFLTIALANVATTPALAMIGAVVVVFGVLLSSDIAAIRQIRRMANPFPPESEEERLEGRVHWFPFAVILRLPRHHLLAALFCLVVIVTVVLVPETARVGYAPAWFVWIALGCGPVAIWAGWTNTNEAQRSLHEVQTKA